jgi:DNA-binding CsgD family transcriptional regulator
MTDTNGRSTELMTAFGDVSRLTAAEMKLQEMNTALSALIRKTAEDRTETQRNICANIHMIVKPYLQKLAQTGLNETQIHYLGFIETNLDNITSSFAKSLSAMYHAFTRREIEIANLVRSGRKTQEIAALLSISRRSVEFHKDNIRKKMGLKHKKINLRSYLMSLD